MQPNLYSVTAYSKIRNRPIGSYDRDRVHAILDVGLVAHVGLILDGRAIVIPMAYARVDETIYIHGAKATRLIKKPADHVPVCVTVSHIDGLVVARSAFHHSVNYRSVVVHGSLRRVNDPLEIEAALVAVTNHLLPGRWDEVRPMTPKELNATGVLAIDIETASAKVRQGPPKDDEDDYERQIWAGTLPIRQTLQTPIQDPRSTLKLPMPPSLKLAHEKFSAHE